MGMAACCEKVGVKRGRWTGEEDEILKKYIQANGQGSWRSLPKNAGLMRCGKSCRLRWINYLRSDLKRGNISPDEEEVIMKLHASWGNRWSLIASHLPGRTDNEVKNYWNSHLSRKFYSFRRPSNEALPPVVLMDLSNAKRRRGGRTSPSSMKKTKSYIPKRSLKLVVEPKETAFVNSVMPMPPTTTLENETLSSSIPWRVDNLDNLVFGPRAIQKGIENLAAASPNPGTDGGMLFPSAEAETLVFYTGEDNENKGLPTYRSFCCLRDITDDGGLESNGVLKLGDDRDGNKVISEDLATGNLSSTNLFTSNGQLNWDWNLDEEEKMLSWLREITDNMEGESWLLL